jgi:hypothetical protein
MTIPEKPALTSGQKRITWDSWGAFALLVILLFVFLPWQKACLAIGLLFGIAFPFVLIERQIVFAYNAGRRLWPWELLAYVLAVAGLVGILVIDLHRWGALGWWP